MKNQNNINGRINKRANMLNKEIFCGLFGRTKSLFEVSINFISGLPMYDSLRRYGKLYN